ncbi:MAG: glutathione synthase [Candidatus Dasytiphilus stammeri]
MIKLGIVMDPISQINLKKDTSLALLIEAQRRNWKIFYMELHDIYLCNEVACALTRTISIVEHQSPCYSFGREHHINLNDLNVILMRKDPPVDSEFIYATHILERAENTGTLIVNKPRSLRDCNEKIFASCFPHFIPDSLVTSNKEIIYNFCRLHGDIVLKPLDGKGGESIFRLTKNDPNISVIIEIMTNYGNNYCMVQSFLPDIIKGDKRVFIVDGQPVQYCLARIPPVGEIRGNLAVGGYGKVQSLSKIDWDIARSVSSTFKEMGLLFVGLDIIGNKLTEINITSPTGVQEIESECSLSITGMIMDMIENTINQR